MKAHPRQPSFDSHLAPNQGCGMQDASPIISNFYRIFYALRRVFINFYRIDVVLDWLGTMAYFVHTRAYEHYKTTNQQFDIYPGLIAATVRFCGKSRLTNWKTWWKMVSMGFDGFRWGLMGFDGFRWGLMGFDGVWWGLMGLDGFRWGLMGFDGFRWVSMGFDGVWWVSMGFDGSWWVSNVIHQYLIYLNKMGNCSGLNKELGYFWFFVRLFYFPAQWLRFPAIRAYNARKKLFIFCKAETFAYWSNFFRCGSISLHLITTCHRCVEV